MLAQKRNHNGKAPVRHEILLALLDKMHCEQPVIATVDMPAIPDIDKPAAIEDDIDISIVTNPKRKIDFIDIDESSDEDLHEAMYGRAKANHALGPELQPLFFLLSCSLESF